MTETELILTTILNCRRVSILEGDMDELTNALLKAESEFLEKGS